MFVYCFLICLAQKLANRGVEISEHKANNVDIQPGGTTNVHNMAFKFKSIGDLLLNFKCYLIPKDINITISSDCGPQQKEGDIRYNSSQLPFGNYTFMVSGTDPDTGDIKSSSFDWVIKQTVVPPTNIPSVNPFKMCSPPKEFNVYGFYGAPSLSHASRILYTISGIANNNVTKSENFTLQNIDVIRNVKQNSLLANISVESNGTNYLIGVQNLSALSECDFEVSSERANNSSLPHSYIRPSHSFADTNPFLDCGNQSPDKVTYSIIPYPLPKYGMLALNDTKTDILVSIYPSNRYWRD